MISRRRDCRPRSIQTFYDFIRCEYIENTPTAYIDTLIKGSDKISIQLKYVFKKNSEDTYSGYMFGSRVANNDRQYGIINSYTKQFRFGNDVSLTNYITNEDILVTLDNTEKHNELKIFDSSNNLLHTLTTTNNSFSNNLNLYIFGINNNGSLSAFSDTTKLYSCKIYDGTTLIRDYIPMHQISTDTYGLWDRVTEEFYTSPNGVKFTGSERVIADADDNLYYIKNYVGARGYYSYVDTGIKGASTDVVKVSVMTTSRPSTGWCWLIGYQTSESNRFGIYHRGSDNQYRFIVDFWRGNSGISRHYSNVYPYLNRRYDLVVGNDTLDSTDKGFMYDERSNVFILPKYRTINTTSSNDTYCVSEIRAQKANYYNRYYNVEIYKQINKKKVLVLHYIPTQRVEDGIYGFFDTVTKTFHPSQGSEQFTGG